MFTTSDLAREVLLVLTGPRNYDPAERTLDRAASARLRRVLVDELHEAPEQPLQMPEPTDDRLRAIARMLRENPEDNTALAELGRTIGASARTLSRLFRDELGMTFYEWRTQLRIYHALVLLADGRDTTHVAHACGWANPSHFIAAFTKLIGTTPGRHRTSLWLRSASTRRAGTFSSPARSSNVALTTENAGQARFSTRNVERTPHSRETRAGSETIGSDAWP